MLLIRIIFKCLCLCLAFGALGTIAPAQSVKRVIILKIDGLPAFYVDEWVKKHDPRTGRSELPWVEEVFYRNGTRVPNFYTRGMSLSGPSWGQIDTGQHLQIKGNVEYDRFTMRAYDYLNFFPYYTSYARGGKVDMPAVEVMDQLQIPIMSDAFPFERKYTAQQLFQRGNDWAVLASGFVNLYPGDPTDFLNEWTIGINWRTVTVRQAERDILGKIVKRPDIDYFDYYDTEFDHVSHHNSDGDTRLMNLKELDRLIGRVWKAVQESGRANETALVLVSDHGFNSTEKVISQGYNIVKWLGRAEGGAHHVVTKRRLMLDYAIKGLYPFTPVLKNASSDSLYLKGQSNTYPTALVDFDGNERSSIHLRNSDLNILHILMQQLKGRKLTPEVRSAATRTLLKIIDKHRPVWRQTARELSEELDALRGWIESERRSNAQNKPVAGEKLSRGEIEEDRRRVEHVNVAIATEKEYRDYLNSLNALLKLDRQSFDPKRIKIEEVVPPGVMGEPNSLFQLQNYVMGPSLRGLTANGAGEIDLEKSFARVNYFERLHAIRVRSNVQPAISNRPIDLVAVRIPADKFGDLIPHLSEDPIWIYGGADRQALLLSREEKDGTNSYKYVPVGNLQEDESGTISFLAKEIGDGFPLRYFEDPDLAVPASERVKWFGEWHSESEWMDAIHKTVYSNGVVALNEHVQRHPLFDPAEDAQLSVEERLIRRFRQRQRHLTEADMLVLAQNLWNFDVRGFNPGGNHGGFFRVSTNSTFMIAGGAGTGIPRGFVVERPYDNMSVAPTIMRLMGKIDDGREPVPELRQKGFRKFPGRVIEELIGPGR